MRPTFHTRLVNGPLFDPIVYCRILNERHAFMLDCGRFIDLTNRELMLLSSIYISHAHMDHFMGFDAILRVILHRDEPLQVYGPAGIRKKVLAKLQSYTWNLTQAYGLEVHIHEIEHDWIHSTIARARDAFEPAESHTAPRRDAIIAHTPWYTVETVILDHSIPCLAFVVKEAFHINIRGEALARKDYLAGPWLGRLKAMIHAGQQEDLPVETRHGMQMVSSEELVRDLVIISPGQKITYLTDIRYSQANLDLILPLARDTDALFIEAFFLDEMRSEAYHKGHLTARQAGEIARAVGAKRVMPMHISPRYHDRIESVLAEIEPVV